MKPGNKVSVGEKRSDFFGNKLTVRSGPRADGKYEILYDVGGIRWLDAGYIAAAYNTILTSSPAPPPPPPLKPQDRVILTTDHGILTTGEAGLVDEVKLLGGAGPLCAWVEFDRRPNQGLYCVPVDILQLENPAPTPPPPAFKPGDRVRFKVALLDVPAGSLGTVSSLSSGERVAVLIDNNGLVVLFGPDVSDRIELLPTPSKPLACTKCHEGNEYAVANQPDGTFLCYCCRSRK